MKITNPVFVSCFAFPLLSHAATYDPEVLERIANDVAQARASGEIPVLVFDVDDTLTDSRIRTQVILEAYGSQLSAQQADPDDASLLVSAPYSEMKFSIDDTLAAIGVQNPGFAGAAKKFWLQEFFSNDYCAVDPPIPGAVKFVDRVHRLGGFVVYLTGRPEPDMKTCTQYGLSRHHFVQGEGTLLLMKPSRQEQDLEFKENAFEQIRGLGRVIAGFENEPANINAYQAAFPGGTMVFLDTIRSESPTLPNAGITWIQNFLY